MPEIGSLEILVVAAVAFVVFGPERLPGMARKVGRYASQFRRTLSEVKDEFRMDLDDDEVRPRRPTRSRPQRDGSSSESSGGDGAVAEGGSPKAAPPPSDLPSSPES